MGAGADQGEGRGGGNAAPRTAAHAGGGRWQAHTPQRQAAAHPRKRQAATLQRRRR